MRETDQRIVVSQMEFQHLQDVYAMGLKLFTPEKSPVLYRTWDEYEILERFMSDSEYCWVAKNHKKIIGFALGALIEKPKAAWIYGYLLWLGVDQKYQTYGVGKKLVDKATKSFIDAGARILMVDTARDNTKAINFFTKHGFDNVEDHVYLSKSLKDHPYYRDKQATKRKKRIKTVPCS